MRKFLFFALSAIFTAGTPAGCNTDYNAISYFVWVNDSDHKITLFVESDLGCEFKNEVILPGESFTAMDNGMGVCPVPSSYIWKMTIIFDDGRLGFTYGVRYYQDDGRSYPPNYDAHYDPSIDDNYVFEDFESALRKYTGSYFTENQINEFLFYERSWLQRNGYI